MPNLTLARRGRAVQANDRVTVFPAHGADQVQGLRVVGHNDDAVRGGGPGKQTDTHKHTIRGTDSASAQRARKQPHVHTHTRTNIRATYRSTRNMRARTSNLPDISGKQPFSRWKFGGKNWDSSSKLFSPLPLLLKPMSNGGEGAWSKTGAEAGVGARG